MDLNLPDDLSTKETAAFGLSGAFSLNAGLANVASTNLVTDALGSGDHTVVFLGALLAGAATLGGLLGVIDLDDD